MDDADEDELDWFGHPLPAPGPRARLAVPCPFCSELFQEGPALASHLRVAHDYTIGSRRRSPLDRLPGWLRGLGFFPLWFVAPLTVGLVVLVFAIVDQWDTWLAVVCAAFATFPLVLVLAHRVYDRRA